MHRGTLFFMAARRREDAGNVEPKILIEPIAFEAVTRKCDIRRILDVVIVRAGVIAGNFSDLDVQVLPVACRRESQLATPGELRLRHPRSGVTFLIRIIDIHLQVARCDRGPFHEGGIGVGRCGQLPIFCERLDLLPALRVGTGGNTHILRHHIDPGVACHETHP